MRAQRSGHVVNMSLIAGLRGFEGSSVYCATKFALEGRSESLAMKLAQFGIETTLVEPGRFRIDFLDFTSVSQGYLAIANYAEYAVERKTELAAANHTQPGDPARLGRALVTLLQSTRLPVCFAAG